MMKQIVKFLAAGIVMIAFSANTFAQVSATATATATIVAPIAITKTTDMNFGNVAVNASAGTVILAPDGTRTTSGGVTLPATIGTVAAAAFNVTGTAGYTYTIVITGAPLTVTSGANTMTVTAFTSTPVSPGTLVAGNNALTVGATLNVAGSQAPGIYVSGTPFTVTVNYN
jgi:hypothetical protein